MGSEGYYAWSSLSCSSVSTTSSSMSAADDEGDRMVKIELEAAEALADLAYLAVRESSGREWGSKGKRARKRVKSESPPADSALNLNPVVDSVPSYTDLAEDQAVLSQQQCEKICTIVLMEPETTEQETGRTELKVEEDSELQKPIRDCTTSDTSFGFRKSRRNFTEAEKEERRIRRVLANRESARQTIRRRQALCEDLTKKAAGLAWENENLKREKEAALKEYQSLETTNKHLKDEMAKVVIAEVEETPRGRMSADVAALTSSSNCPLLWYNHPRLTPIFWPSINQSSSYLQSLHERQSASVNPSKVPIPAASSPGTSQEQEKCMDVNMRTTPLYVLPYPWFFPLPDPCNGPQPQPSIVMTSKRDETSDNNQYTASSSSKVFSDEEKQYCFFPAKVKTEACGSTEFRPPNDLNENPVGFPPDGGGQHAEAHCKEMLFTPSGQNCAQSASIVEHESRPQLENPSDIATPSTACHNVSASPEKIQESVSYPGKKLIDVVAAAEARKRRKELTKLKNLHGRQCRMHC